MLFVIYSCIGWTMETVRGWIITKKFVNRGFLIGPYCPIYGLSCVSMMLMLDRYKYDILIVFVFAAVICSIIEYLTSWLMEKIYKTRWWDYSNIKFNINGRICLQNAVIFGLLALVILYIVNPVIMSLIELIPIVTLQIVSFVLFIIIFSDFVTTLFVMKFIKKISFEAKKDNTEEVTKKVKELLVNSSNVLVRRLSEAFPNLKSTLKSRREELREQLDDLIHSDLTSFVSAVRNRGAKIESEIKDVNEETIEDLREEIMIREKVEKYGR